MSISVVAKSPSEFGQVLDVVHDRTLELENLRFEETTGVITIPLLDYDDWHARTGSRRIWLFQRVRIPVRAAELVILNAESYLTHDPDRLRQVVVDRFQFSAEAGTLTIAGCTSASLTARVKELHVEAHVKDSIVRWRESWCWR